MGVWPGPHEASLQASFVQLRLLRAAAANRGDAARESLVDWLLLISSQKNSTCPSGRLIRCCQTERRGRRGTGVETRFAALL